LLGKLQADLGEKAERMRLLVDVVRANWLAIFVLRHWRMTSHAVHQSPISNLQPVPADCRCYDTVFFARDSICYSAYMLSPVRLSVCLSHGWISQKRLTLGSCNFHHRVAPWL